MLKMLGESCQVWEASSNMAREISQTAKTLRIMLKRLQRMATAQNGSLIYTSSTASDSSGLREFQAVTD